MKNKSKVLNVRLKSFQFARLKEFAERHGFTSVSELVRAALMLVVIHTGCEPDSPERDEIQEMFREFADNYRQPDGTVPVRHHRRQLK